MKITVLGPDWIGLLDEYLDHKGKPSVYSDLENLATTLYRLSRFLVLVHSESVAGLHPYSPRIFFEYEYSLERALNSTDPNGFPIRVIAKKDSC